MRSQLTLLTLGLGATLWMGCPAGPDSGTAQNENTVAPLLGNDLNTEQAPPPIAAPSSADTKASETADATYLLALQQFQRNDFKAALVEVDKCLSQFPNYVDAWYLKGNCHFAQAEHDKAIEAYKKVVELDKSHYDARYNLGQCYTENKDYKAAVSVLRDLVNERTSPTYLMALGRALSLNGDHPQAVRALKVSVVDFPDDPTPKRYLADSLMALGKTDEAAPVYEALIKLDPLNEGVHFNYALALEGGKKTDEAIVEYKKVLEINPRNATAYLNMGAIYADRKDTRSAVQALESFLQLNPDGEKAAKIRAQLAAFKAAESGSSGGGEQPESPAPAPTTS